MQTVAYEEITGITWDAGWRHARPATNRSCHAGIYSRNSGEWDEDEEE
ncbi:MAG: hypothetical protein LIO96_05765 [Lachnospiraceae bacterium]|nr:hypothetical protein [Lachnospiraceae bacterium]